MRNIIIPTCMCANNSDYSYSLKPSLSVLPNNTTALSFTLTAYDSDGEFLDSTCFVFIILSIIPASALIGLSFRMQMLRLLKELTKTPGGRLDNQIRIVLAGTTCLLVAITTCSGQFFRQYIETIKELSDNQQDCKFFKIEVTKHHQTETFFELKHFNARNCDHGQDVVYEPSVVTQDTNSGSIADDVPSFDNDYSPINPGSHAIESSPAAIVEQLYNSLRRTISSASDNQIQPDERRELLEQLSLETFASGGYSASENHLDLAEKFSSLIPSPVEFSQFISLFDFCLFNLLAISLFVTLLSIVIALSYYKREFLLKKDFISQFRSDLQNIQVVNALNKIRKQLTMLLIFFNCTSMGLLIALWYTFKITIKYFGL